MPTKTPTFFAVSSVRFLTTCCLFLSWASCDKPATTSSSTAPRVSPEASPRQLAASPNHESGQAQFDVCGLLRRDEIEARLGLQIKEHKSSGHLNGSLHISQCIYVADLPSNSVSLVVTQQDSRLGGKQSVRDFWHKAFGRYREQGKEEKEEEERPKELNEEAEEEGEGRPPRKIEGLGDEAFWTAGSLYVLEKDVFLRLSIGGSHSEELKLEHSKALAALALKRL